MKQMVSLYPIFILVISLVCMTCGEGTSDKETLPITDLPLLEKDIYNNYFRVEKARKIASDAHKVVAKKKLEESILLINTGEQQAGIDTLIRSILHYPTAKAYFQLGNIHLESGEHEEAINAYNMVRFIDNEPNKHLLYNLACAYAMDDSDWDGKRRAINYLRTAVRNGYTQKDSLLNDPRLDNIRYSYEFNKIYLEIFGENDDRQVEQFKLFTHLFPIENFPIQIEPEDLNNYLIKKRRLHYPLTSIIGREEYIPNEEHYFAVTILKKTSKFVAVMYLACPVSSPKRPYQNYEISTYTPEGKNIDRLLFADTSNPDKYFCGEIDKELNITLSTYLNIWKKNPDEYGYRNNEIDYFEFMYEEKFRINKKGKIEKQ